MKRYQHMKRYQRAIVSNIREYCSLAPVSPVKIIGMAFIDLLIVTVTLSFIVEFLRFIAFEVPQWLGGVLAVMAFIYALLAYRGIVKSPGRWAHGVRRYTYSEVEGYSGYGVLFVNENLPGPILSKRAMILALYFGGMILIMSVLNNLK